MLSPNKTAITAQVTSDYAVNSYLMAWAHMSWQAWAPSPALNLALGPRRPSLSRERSVRRQPALTAFTAGRRSGTAPHASLTRR